RVGRGARLSGARVPDRRGGGAAAGGVAQLADPDRAEGSDRAIFRAVRADRKSHLVHRTAADRNHHGADAEPEGGDGGAGAVFRYRAGTAGPGAGLISLVMPGLVPDKPGNDG